MNATVSVLAENPAENSAAAVFSVLDVQGVTVYLGGRTILKDISFQVKPGEFVGILGPNGAGKTTLFRVLLQMIKPQKGKVVLNRDVQVGKSAIGYVPQSRQIDPDLPMWAWDFVSLGLPHSFRPWMNNAEKAAVQDALELTGALHLARKPIGLLSGGERQRVFLAQALVRSPQILLLDEPTSNLDPGAQEAMAELVHTVCRTRNISVLFISHDVNLVNRYADRILYLTPEHYAMGTVEEVMQPAVLGQLYGSAVNVVRLDGKLFITGAGS